VAVRSPGREEHLAQSRLPAPVTYLVSYTESLCGEQDETSSLIEFELASHREDLVQGVRELTESQLVTLYEYRGLPAARSSPPRTEHVPEDQLDAYE
jgi:hypothetical protein